jgi:hypothetical protein
MRTLLFAVFVTLALALVAVPTPVCAGGCGMKPMKPMVPMGCRDLAPVCMCDSRGDNCRWQWQCVK